MSTFWVELHCEGRPREAGCYSNSNDHPGVLVRNLAKASVSLAEEAKEKQWQKMRFGWLRPNCLKQGWRP